MTKGVSYQKKNSLLLSGIAALLLLAIAGPIRSTTALYFENDQLGEELQFAKRAPGELAKYRKEAKVLEELIRFKEHKIDLKTDILSTVSSAVEQTKVVLLKLEEPQTHMENDFAIETHEIVLQGDFVSLLKVVVLLQDNLSSGKIVSSRFILEKAPTKTALIARIYIQTSKQS